MLQEFEDTKEVIEIRKFKDRQHNGEKKRKTLSGLYNNFFSNLSLWASNFLDWLVQIKTSLVQKSLYI